GADARDVRVAIAWGDGQLRVWNPATNQIIPVADGNYNDRAALLSAAGTFATASNLDRRTGVIREWRFEDGNPVRGRTVTLPLADGVKRPVPRDFVFYSGGDRLAVLVNRQAENLEDDVEELLLVDARSGGSLVRKTLGKPTLNNRRLAVDPSGQFLLVSDGDNREILLFRTADLDRKLDPLQGIGTNFQKVSFRKKGDSLGLLLTDAAKNEVIFDFMDRRLIANDNTWAEFVADRERW